ncbi:hypothetical protein NM688_g8598 [Phlebia brevispora]|uniref:Uncharacterized protein n=1 Tax=Phlebia brevispora TaxID=194682 RepID=A0ACC1RQH4_9APHY|nr:hypothetical protein NM688_g8598 [Phlebia brevispora]
MDLSHLGNKAFGMSQPILGVNTDNSMTDNEEQSDSSPTVSGSPTYTMPPKAKTTELPSSAQGVQQQIKPQAPSPHVDATPKAPPTNGLPPVTPASSGNAVDGLPASDDHSWVVLESDKKPASAQRPDEVREPPASTSTASSSTVTATVEDGLADSGSHDSAQVRVEPAIYY